MADPIDVALFFDGKVHILRMDPDLKLCVHKPSPEVKAGYVGLVDSIPDSYDSEGKCIVPIDEITYSYKGTFYGVPVFGKDDENGG